MPDDAPPDGGIEVAVQIRDLGDLKDNGSPHYYTHRQRMSESMLASSSNRDLVEAATEMAVREVVDTWREERDPDGGDA